MPQIGNELQRKAVDTSSVTGISKDADRRLALSLVKTPRPSSIGGVGSAGKAWAQLFKHGSDVLGKFGEKARKEEYVRGQMLQQQGKTMQELEDAGESPNTLEGYSAMSATSEAHKWYNQAIAGIQNGDDAMHPDQYAGVLQNQFSNLLTGDSVNDTMITALSAELMPKLVSAQMRAHTAYAENQTYTSYRDMLVSRALSGDETINDALDLSDNNDLIRGLTPERRKSAVTEAIQLTLEQGNDGLVKALGMRVPIKTPDVKSGADLGEVSAKYESSADSATIGKDSTGGVSYGRYQIATGPGTFDAFLSWAAASDNPSAKAVAAELNASDDKAKTWVDLAKSGRLGNIEHDFIKSTHYDRTMRNVDSPDLVENIAGSRALQEAIWSTSVQHGASGAARLINKVYRPGMSDAAFIKALYEERKGQFTRSTNKERAAVNRRLNTELGDIMNLVAPGTRMPEGWQDKFAIADWKNKLTKLSSSEEKEFQKWAKKTGAPITEDYDMRGFWKYSKNSESSTGINSNDGKLHYTDEWKTPLHKSFSEESRYAKKGSGAPRWNSKDQLVLPSGEVVFDERGDRFADINKAMAQESNMLALQGYSSAQVSGIMRAMRSYDSEQQNKFNAALERDIRDLRNKVRSGDLTYDEGIDAMQTIADKYGKDDRFKAVAASNIGSAADTYESSTKTTFNPERDKALRDIRLSVRSGETTYDEGIKAIQDVADRYGEDDKFVTSEASRIETAADSYWSEHRRGIQADAKQAAKDAEFTANVRSALSSGNVWSLDNKGQRAAWKMLDQDLSAQMQQKIDSGELDQATGQEWFNNQRLSAMATLGVVDKQTARQWSSIFSSNVVGADGHVNQNAVGAYTMWRQLNDINPIIASQYIDNADARAIVTMASDMDDTNMDAAQALEQAHMRLQRNFTPEQVRATLGSSQFTTALDKEVKKQIDDIDPGFFTTLFGGSASGFYNVWDSEIAKATKDPYFKHSIKTTANAYILRNPAIDPKAAAKMATEDVMGRSAFMLGQMVQTSSDSTIREDMGIVQDQRPMAENQAMLEYLQTHGEEMWGEDFGDWGLFSPSTWRTAIRGVPEMNIQYDAASRTFLVAPIDKETMALGPVHRLPASRVGAEYMARIREEVQHRADIEAAPTPFGFGGFR